MNGTAQIGVTELAVMGRNLGRNSARNGFTVTVHNRTTAKTGALVEEFGDKGAFVPAHTPQEFVAALGRPRRLVIIDGGNAHFEDTRRRRKELRECGIRFVGVGVSGGEEGALDGPSNMPGGSAESYVSLGPTLERIAARAKDGTPCTTHIGPDGRHGQLLQELPMHPSSAGCASPHKPERGASGARSARTKRSYRGVRTTIRASFATP